MNTNASVWNGRWKARLVRRAPAPEIYARLAAQGLHPVAARVLAARIPDDAERLAAPGLQLLDDPGHLPDIAPAAAAVAASIIAGDPIGIVSDSDVDGITGHALTREAFRAFGVPENEVVSFIGHKLLEGYGLSDSVAERILAAAPAPRLIVTIDCGSSDGARISRLAAAGVATIVTDHHEIPREGVPAAAVACVSPARSDSRYPDAAIAGCMVAWLLMCEVRRTLIARGHLPEKAPRLARLLDYVALGTVADCVTLATSANNRAVVRAGLQLIGAGARPCWAAARAFVGDRPVPSAQDLAFSIAPRINARSRLADPLAGLQFLLAPTVDEASRLAQLLDRENEARKAVERELTAVAMERASVPAAAGAVGLAVWLPEGHPGVQGIVASRLVERFGAPAACLSPHWTRAGVASGSARGVDGFHVRDALEHINEHQPGLLRRFGGHRGAGGFEVATDRVDDFLKAFDRAATAQLATRPGPVIWSDGAIALGDINDAIVSALDELEPYGREFPPAQFELEVTVRSTRVVGAQGNHLQMDVEGPSGRALKAIWFNACAPDEVPPEFDRGRVVRLLVCPTFNHFNGRITVQLQVKGLVM